MYTVTLEAPMCSSFSGYCKSGILITKCEQTVSEGTGRSKRDLYKPEGKNQQI